MAITKTLEQIVKESPATQALLKDLQRRVNEAGAALGDIRKVAELTRKLADMQWELDDLLKNVQTQARAKNVVALAVKPTDWTPTKAQIDAFMKSPEYRAMVPPDSRVKRIEKTLFQQVSGDAKTFHNRHSDGLPSAA